MTKDRVDRNQNRTEEMDEEACRRLMVLLCGSEEEADAMGDALMRYATPEEEELIKKHYELSRQNAQEAGQNVNITLHPRLAGQHFDKGTSPSLTEDEEKEFDAFMQEVYRRAEERSNVLDPSRASAKQPEVNTAVGIGNLGWIVKESFANFRVPEIWRGLIRMFDPLPMAAEGALAESNGTVCQYSGAEVDLTTIVSRSVIDQELRWAAGKLQLMCARSADGRILSIRASVGRNKAAPAIGAEIILMLRDKLGETAILTLKPDRPSIVSSSTPLSGELENIELSVRLGQAA